MRKKRDDKELEYLLLNSESQIQDTNSESKLKSENILCDIDDLKNQYREMFKSILIDLRNSDRSHFEILFKAGCMYNLLYKHCSKNIF